MAGNMSVDTQDFMGALLSDALNVGARRRYYGGRSHRWENALASKRKGKHGRKQRKFLPFGMSFRSQDHYSKTLLWHLAGIVASLLSRKGKADFVLTNAGNLQARLKGIDTTTGGFAE